jgi:hypothetical protein
MTGRQMDSREMSKEIGMLRADVQPEVQQPADFPDRFPQLLASGRDHRGRFLPGNSEAVTHGAYRNVDRPELRALIEAERAAVIETLGGEDELTPQMLRVVESYAENAVLAEAALLKVLEGGLTTTKGAQRAIVRVWQQLDEAVVRRAQLLGLERRQRRVPSLAQVMNE